MRSAKHAHRSVQDAPSLPYAHARIDVHFRLKNVICLPTSAMKLEAQHTPPAWIFAVLGINTYNSIVISLPFILRKIGVSVPEIAGMLAVLGAPGAFLFLGTPLVDVGFRRK